MADKYAVILTTTASQEDARDIAKKVLDEKLAACVQLMPIQSLYTWKGEIAQEDEVLLLIKTRTELYSALEQAILSVHKYETPEVVLLPINEGSKGYLGWINDVT